MPAGIRQMTAPWDAYGAVSAAILPGWEAS
jgi:hypothetical protein